MAQNVGDFISTLGYIIGAIFKIAWNNILWLVLVFLIYFIYRHFKNKKARKMVNI